jgi:hypothetical protein
MGVQVMPPGDHVLVQVGDAVVHGLLSARAPILPRAREKSDLLGIVIIRASGW